jgi:hypothetical protein
MKLWLHVRFMAFACRRVNIKVASFFWEMAADCSWLLALLIESCKHNGDA